MATDRLTLARAEQAGVEISDDLDAAYPCPLCKHPDSHRPNCMLARRPTPAELEAAWAPRPRKDPNTASE